MKSPRQPDLELRGKLIRSLGALREMLPGSFVERTRACGRPGCHCADGKRLHSQYQISVLIDGQPKALHIPAELVEKVRQKIEMRRRFEAAAATICQVRLKRNGVLRSDWSRGLVVGAVDGIEICSSFARCCDACMEREVQHKVNGEMQTDIQYYHRIVVVVLVSTDFPIPLGVRFQKNGETEVSCALALLQDLVGQLGRRFLDVLVGDALYLQAPFVKEVERLGLVWAFTLKENQPDLLREAERLTQESPTGVQEEPDREIRYWHLPEVDWPVADRQIRVVKTVRIEQQRRVTVRGKDAARMKGKTAILLPSTTSYATNFELGSISPLFIHQLSRSRWRIDTEVFQTITTDCHLKHPAVHQTTALVVLTMIRFLAYTLSLVFYQRQVRSHARRKCETFRDFAKRLAYWFVTLSPNTS